MASAYVSRNLKSLIAASILATVAVLGVSAVQPKEAAAAGVYDSVYGTCEGGQIALTAEESRSVQLHNSTRASNGLASLCASSRLTNAARGHSQDMINRGYFSHTTPEGTTFAARIQAQGYSFSTAGENIAYGSGSAADSDDRFTAWMNSPGHRANILSSSIQEIGVGAAYSSFNGTPGVTMYTADFGGQTTSSTTSPSPKAKKKVKKKVKKKGKRKAKRSPRHR